MKDPPYKLRRAVLGKEKQRDLLNYWLSFWHSGLQYVATGGMVQTIAYTCVAAVVVGI